MDGLRHGGWKAMSFELSEAGGEDSLWRSEGLEELSGRAGAEAGREGKRQPGDVAIGIVDVVAERQVREGTFTLE